MSKDIYYYQPKNRGMVKTKILVQLFMLFMLLGVVGYKKGFPMVKDYLGEKSRDKQAQEAEVKLEAPVVPETPKTEEVKKEIVIPASAHLSLPFTPQAPNRNWDDATGYGYACEEAALLMNHYYLTGRTFPDGKIPREEAMDQLDKMMAWQQTHYGYARDAKDSDLNMERLGRLAADYYGYKYRVIELSPDSIKKEIAQGNMVIVPVMTEPLRVHGRGQYSPGNVFHVFPIIGYREDGVIAHDNGFTQGKNWFYSWDVVLSAIDQQHTNTPSRQGLVLYK